MNKFNNKLNERFTPFVANLLSDAIRMAKNALLCVLFWQLMMVCGKAVNNYALPDGWLPVSFLSYLVPFLCFAYVWAGISTLITAIKIIIHLFGKVIDGLKGKTTVKQSNK